MAKIYDHYELILEILIHRISMRFILTLLILLNLSFNAVAGVGVPRPLGGENRIKIINYMPNTVYKFVGHYEYQSIIEFAQDEVIDTISMGTPSPWQLVPAGNRIFLKPVEENATTNMTVITNKRIYFFEMHAQEAVGIDDKALNFIVQFVYPEHYKSKGAVKTFETANSSAPDLTNPKIYNFEYTISGNAYEIEPIRVFDDGEFTYFKFRDINAEIPAIFWVDARGRESLINYRINDDYVVVERVTDKFTLRHGEDVICVFNEKLERKIKAQNKKYNKN